MKKRLLNIVTALTAALTLAGCQVIEDFWAELEDRTELEGQEQTSEQDNNPEDSLSSEASEDNLASADDVDFIQEVNDNVPEFTAEDLGDGEPYEDFTPLDDLGRVGPAQALIEPQLFPDPDEERESISHVKPSGWQSIELDFVDGGWLYNRSHLIGWQLTGQNDLEENLMTGTRQFNVDGMLPVENWVKDTVEDGQPVIYRVTPDFHGDELVARGLQMEGQSILDEGQTLQFNLYIANQQDGVVIDYATGEAEPEPEMEDAA